MCIQSLYKKVCSNTRLFDFVCSMFSNPLHPFLLGTFNIIHTHIHTNLITCWPPVYLTKNIAEAVKWYRTTKCECTSTDFCNTEINY